MLRLSRGLLGFLGKVELVAAIIILFAIVGIILSQVFSRYVLGRPLIFAEELATYLLIWLGFVAATVAYKLRRHITIQTYAGFVSPRIARISEAMVHVLIAIILIIVISYIPDAMQTERRQSTVGLPINIGRHWFFSVPTLIACVSLCMTAVFYSLDAVFGSGEPILGAASDPSLDDDLVEQIASEGGRT